ncbi:MFS transporter [Novosphingobium sp. SG707]|uniref:MFS transporter n=1 Tax=Novosphingobium sp. SG707 TaxID=2586996 RepID=UPI0014452AAD|nr:MFS transporter [Novosphingobium sp. SG707]NKI99276.1 EmrB/QacA subfamily drug resistance transporter [Novosphingobium sp. SG707]
MDLPAGKPRNFRLIALVIASALLMQQLDATVLAVAMPAMARDLKVPASWLSVGLTSYLVALAIFIPASGYLADRWGARRIYCAAIVVFLLGSVGCAQVQGLGALVVARMVQGLGGALMMPVGRLILIRCTPREELMAALSWLVMPALVGPILGPPLGGFIITWLDWRWIFYINLPVGVLGLVLALWLMPPMPSGVAMRFDGKGFVLSGAALGCGVFGLELVSRAWGGPLAWALLAAGLMWGWSYVRHARRVPGALLDLSLLRIPSFGLSVAAGNLIRIAQGAQPFLLALMLQTGFHRSAAAAGVIAMAGAVGAVVMKPLAPRIIGHFGYRTSLSVAGIISSIGYGALAFWQEAWPSSGMMAVLAATGFFTSLGFTGYNTAAFLNVPAERMSAATSLYATIQQLCFSLGICIAGVVLEVVGHVAVTGASVIGYRAAFLAVAVVSAWALLFNIRLLNRY